MREEMRSHAELARLAGRQHGVVTRAQLLALGLSHSAIGRMSGARRLHPVHRGVYAVGNPALCPHGRCFAAVAACGREALLSHDSAAWLWGLDGTCPSKSHVTVPVHGHRRRDIILHRAPTVAEEGRGDVEGIPVTPVHRVLLDLAATKSIRSVERRIDRAERLGLLDLIEIDAMLARRRGDRGTSALGAALDLYRDEFFNRARSERLFLRLVEKAGLPRPAFNLFVAGLEIDVYWELERFAVEIDGWEAHRTRKAFETDRVRQEQLKLAGIDSILITARRIERDPAEVGDHLRRLLAQRRNLLSADD